MGTYDDLTKRYRFGGAEIAFGKPNISIAEEKQVGGVLRLTVEFTISFQKD